MLTRHEFLYQLSADPPHVDSDRNSTKAQLARHLDLVPRQLKSVIARIKLITAVADCDGRYNPHQALPDPNTVSSTPSPRTMQSWTI